MWLQGDIPLEITKIVPFKFVAGKGYEVAESNEVIILRLLALETCLCL